MVVGGGDSAFEEALFLTRFGSSVTLIHRRDSFRASQIMVDRAKANPTITLMTNTVVTSITGTSSPTQNTGAPIAIPGLTLKRPAVAPASVSSIAVRNVVTGEESTLDTNAVFVAIGHTPATDFAAGVVDRDDDGYVVVQGASTVTSCARHLCCRRLRGSYLSSSDQRSGHGLPCSAGCAGLSYGLMVAD